MRPSGTDKPAVYILGLSPSEADDQTNDHWRDKGGQAIYDAFGAKFMKSQVRSNYIVQCRGDVDEVITECCRRRIIEDIERTKPDVIVTVGDAPLRWIGGKLDGKAFNALNFRGSKFVAKVGNHSAHVFPLIYPNYAFKRKQYGKSEYELAMEFDVAAIKEFALSGSIPEPVVYAGNYADGIEQIDKIATLEKRLADMAALPEVAFDIETNGFRPFRLAEPLLLTAAIGTFEDVIAFPIDHPGGWDTKRERLLARGLLGEWLLWAHRRICHHLGMEMEWCNYFFGAKSIRSGEWDDTMAMAHTLDERKGTMGLEVLSVMHFGFNLKSQSNVDAGRILEYPLKDVLRYNGMDSKWTFKLAEKLRPLIMDDAALRTEYERKVRLAPTLTLTECKGIPVSMEVARKMDEGLLAQAEQIERKIKLTPEVQKFNSSFGTFRPTSDEDVLKLMRDVLKREEIKVENWDGSTSMTTGEEALSAMPASEVPSASLILEHRGAAKLRGTYTQNILTRKIVDRDGRVRAKYGSMVAETGRLNSDDPNIQNWPKRKFREIRRIMTTDGWVTTVKYADDTEIQIKEDRCFLACDYGQIEFRVVGMASEDPEIVKACWTGYDVHKFWAERMVDIFPDIRGIIEREFHVDWDEKGLKLLRQEAKNKWVFPQLFGASTKSCAAQLWLPQSAADELAGEFWDTFRAAKKWQDRILKNYERTLSVETLGGRKRRGPLTKNQIINHPIQGTAADIVTAAMTSLSERSYVEDDEDLHPSMNVHDDLTFLPRIGYLDQLIPKVAEEMCKLRFDYINVPLMVEVSIGTNWCDLEEIKKFRSDELFGTPNPYKE